MSAWIKQNGWDKYLGYGLTEAQVCIIGQLADGDRLVEDSVWRPNGGSDRRGGHVLIYRWNEPREWASIANIASLRALERVGFIRKLKGKTHCFTVVKKALKAPEPDTLDPEVNRLPTGFPDTGNPARPYRVVPMKSNKTRGGDWCYRSSIIDGDGLVVRRSACSPEAPAMFKEVHRLNDIHEKGYNAALVEAS